MVVSLHCEFCVILRTLSSHVGGWEEVLFPLLNSRILQSFGRCDFMWLVLISELPLKNRGGLLVFFLRFHSSK